MTLVRTKPKVEKFDGLFDNLFFPEFHALNRAGSAMTKAGSPKVNIKEGNEDYLVELAVPGIAKEDIKIQLDQNVLKVYSEIEPAEEKEGNKFTRKEFFSQSFRKEFNLPEDADTEKIDAHYLNGILSIQVPKKEEAKPQPPKSIQIV